MSEQPSSATTPPATGVTAQMERNVRTVAKLERDAMAERTTTDRLSDGITRVAGSAGFVAVHAIGFAVWIALNVGAVPKVAPFDPYPFSFLTLVVSLEAIFLAIFVLMSQNRMSRMADRRAHLDLQVDLLSERENTVMLHMLRSLCETQGIRLDDLDREAQDLLTETDVTALASDLQAKLPEA